MKPVILAVGNVDPSRPGAGDVSYVRAHARAAIRAGYEPHLFCVTPGSGVLETDFGTLHRVASPVGPYRVTMLPAHAPVLATAVRRFLQDHVGPHLIHGFGAWGYVGVRVGEMLRRRAVDVRTLTSVFTTEEHQWRAKLAGLTSAHGRRQRLRYWTNYAWIRGVVRHYERRAYEDSSLVALNYESVRRLFQATYGHRARIRRLPYSSEKAFLPEEPGPAPEVPAAIAGLEPRSAPLVLTLSRHDPRKGLDVLLHALARLRADGVPFRACLVGGGRLLAPHRSLAARLGLSGMIAITGWVPDPQPYLRHADVFVLPSLQEGSGSVSLLEALQAGVAVVASGVDGIPEDVVDGDSSLLVPPGNAQDLREAVGRAVTDGDLRRGLARRGRETFLRRFSADAFSRALDETYAELLAVGPVALR